MQKQAKTIDAHFDGLVKLDDIIARIDSALVRIFNTRPESIRASKSLTSSTRRIFVEMSKNPLLVELNAEATTVDKISKPAE